MKKKNESSAQQTTVGYIRDSQSAITAALVAEANGHVPRKVSLREAIMYSQPCAPPLPREKYIAHCGVADFQCTERARLTGSYPLVTPPA